jgi:hypothetical protein
MRDTMGRPQHTVALLCTMVCLVASFLPAGAQRLPLPARPVGAPGGDASAALLAPLTRDEREEQVFQQILAGNVPDFLRTLIPLSTTATVQGHLRTLEWYVAPEYLAIGSDSDYFLMPMTPLLAQRIADAVGCTLPTRHMVDAIYAAATVKVAPIPIPPSAAMITIPVFKQHNDTLRAQRAPLLTSHPLGELVGGNKKDVVISPLITTNLKPNVPKPVVIYGWHQLNGVPIQPLYNGHEQTYADYSHGIRLVQRAMRLDGAAVMADEILRDSVLWPLLSDEGVIANLRYGAMPDAAPGEKGAPAKPDESELLQNYPNPFNPKTTIGFRVRGADAGWVNVTVYDVLGRLITTLVDTILSPGEYAAFFDGTGLPSGVYYYRMQVRPLASAIGRDSKCGAGRGVFSRSCLLLR